jgi:cytochrome c
LAATIAAALIGPASAQDAAAGEKLFGKCAACHAVGEAAKTKVGPILNGLDGRKSGTAGGFSYSDAHRTSGIVWSDAEFADYIKDPKAKIPGTRMYFAGMKDEREIADLWAFLKQYDQAGKIKVQ